jgi:hypothetical protein
MTRRIAGVVAVVVLAAGLARVDVRGLLGPLKGDEATFVSMAFSVAKDGDLKYRREDFTRFVKLYGTGPEGIFLKQSSTLALHAAASWPPLAFDRTAVPPAEGLDYGKPFAYAIAAAPFAAALGLRGLLLFNLVLLAISIWCAAVFGRARTRTPVGAVLGVAFVGLSVAPVYVVWLTPEIFNFTLVMVAYFLWLYKDVAPGGPRTWLHTAGTDWIAVALLAIATYSKPPNAALIAPMVLTACLRRQWSRAILLGGVFVVLTAGLFGVNAVISGEANYQGGNRYSFYSHFPFDDEGTKFESGKMMTTNEANDENILAPAFLVPTLAQNVVYFLIGRDTGLVPFFFPGALFAALWLLRARREPLWQGAIALGCAIAVLVLLVLAPNIWNGGGGPIGNRYFLSIYPVMLFLLPSTAAWTAAAAVVTVGTIVVGPILAEPFKLKQQPWLFPERWPLRLLPVELTILNQLPVALNPQRYRVPVSSNPEVFLYYLDGNTYFQEPDPSDTAGAAQPMPHNFWVAPGTAQIVVRTERPLTGLGLEISSRVPNHVWVSVG